MDGRAWNASNRGHNPPQQHASPAANAPSASSPGLRHDAHPHSTQQHRQPQQQQQHPQQQWYLNHAAADPYANGSGSSSGSSTPLGMQWPSHASSVPAQRTQPQPEQASQYSYNSKMGHADEAAAQQQYKQLQLAQHQARMLQQSLQQQQQQQQQQRQPQHRAAPPSNHSYHPYQSHPTHGNRAYATPSNSSPNTAAPAFLSSAPNTGSSSNSSRVSLSDFSLGLGTGSNVLHASASHPRAPPPPSAPPSSYPYSSKALPGGSASPYGMTGADPQNSKSWAQPGPPRQSSSSFQSSLSGALNISPREAPAQPQPPPPRTHSQPQATHANQATSVWTNAPSSFKPTTQQSARPQQAAAYAQAPQAQSSGYMRPQTPPRPQPVAGPSHQVGLGSSTLSMGPTIFARSKAAPAPSPASSVASGPAYMTTMSSPDPLNMLSPYGPPSGAVSVQASPLAPQAAPQHQPYRPMPVLERTGSPLQNKKRLSKEAQPVSKSQPAAKAAKPSKPKAATAQPAAASSAQSAAVHVAKKQAKAATVPSSKPSTSAAPTQSPARARPPIVVLPLRKPPPSTPKTPSTATSTSTSTSNPPQTPLQPPLRTPAPLSGNDVWHTPASGPALDRDMYMDREWSEERGNSEEDAEGSDYFSDEIELLPTQSSSAARTPTMRTNRKSAPGTHTRISGGPVKRSHRKAPAQKLFELMENIFEADDTLPSRDDMASMPAGSALPSPADGYFDVHGGVAVLKASTLREVLKAAGASARAARSANATSNRVGRAMSTSSSPEKVTATGPTRIADIEPQQLGRLLRIIERGVHVADEVVVLPPAAATTAAATAKKSKKRKAGPASKAPAKRARPDSAGSRSSRSRSPRKSAAEEEESEREAESEKEEAAAEASTTAQLADTSAAPVDAVDEDTQQAQLGARINLITYSVLAAECCLAILLGDELAKHLVSEDIVRPCFEAIKLALDRVILPFVEACSGAAMAVHPLLELLVRSLAPVAPTKRKRGRASAKAQKIEAQAASALSTGTRSCSDALARIFRTTCSALSQVQRLVKVESLSLSDSIVISAVYAGIQPFFVLEPEPGANEGKTDAARLAARGRTAMEALGGGPAAMRSLRLPCLNLLRNVFARHAEMRQWIIEEILTSLIKLPDMKKNRRQHSLRSGGAINSVTALLLQLVQTASEGASAAKAGKIFGIAEVDIAALDDSQMSSLDEAPVAVSDATYELSAWSRALRGPSTSAKEIAAYLMQKVSSGGKVTKTSTENSYVAIMDNLVGDLLSTLFLPEWPASALLLTNLCRAFALCLEDPKSSADARGVALDHLGPIAARLRQSQLRCAEVRSSGGAQDDDKPRTPLRSIFQIEQSCDVAQLDELNAAYKSIIEHLAASETDDQTAESARDFLVSQWGCELSAVLMRASDALEQAENEAKMSVAEGGNNDEEVTRIKLFIAAVGRSLSRASECADGKSLINANVFETRSEDDYRAVTLVSEELVCSSAFMVSFDFLLQQLLGALDGQAVGNRTRALRGLGRISSVDGAMLEDAEVRESVQTRLSDESAGVREVALGLLGKYALRSPERLELLFPTLRERVNDAGLSVRKRALRLLASVYSSTTQEQMRIDACVRIVRCVFDEDTGIQDLAVSTIGQLWLNVTSTADVKASAVKSKGAAVATPAPVDKDDDDGDEQDDSAALGNTSTESKIAILIAVAGHIRERPSPLEAVLSRIVTRCGPAQADILLASLRDFSDAMIDSLTDGGDVAAPVLVARIRTVFLLVSTNPAVISIAKAKKLLPFLKSAQTQDEFMIMELLLKIFRASLPHMAKTAGSFAASLQDAMTPLVSKPPPHPTSNVLQELIACYCTVIKTSTRNFQLLIKTLTACFSRLRAVRAKVAQDAGSQLDKSARLLMSMTALLCEHADFDKIRVEYPEHAQGIRAISGDRSVTDDVFEVILALYTDAADPQAKTTALQSLGFLFRSYPSLMTRTGMTDVMSRIYERGQVAERELLLKITLEYLTTEQKRTAPGELGARSRTAAAAPPKAVVPQKVDMSELVGNTEVFAESGVSSTLIQLYLDSFLDAARDVAHPGLQKTAMEILKFTVQQGLSHPLQCVPTLIALETVDDAAIAAKALHLHDYLSSKHASILAARYLDFARASFDFQSQLTRSDGAAMRGFRAHADPMQPVALLRGWYSLVRDKRNTRLGFLRAIIKALDVNTAAGTIKESDVLFARYIADNLAVLEYKTVEEVFVVVAQLRSNLSVAGMTVLQHVEDQLGASVDDDDDEDDDEELDLPGSQPIVEIELPISPNLEQSSQSQSQSQSQSEKWSMFKTARSSLIMGTALLLRNHLKALYGLSEQKCQKWKPGKRQSAGADKPASRKTEGSGVMLSLDALHDALGSPATRDRDTARMQMASYEDLMREEGTLDEPLDEGDDD